MGFLLVLFGLESRLVYLFHIPVVIAINGVADMMIMILAGREFLQGMVIGFVTWSLCFLHSDLGLGKGSNLPFLYLSFRDSF